MTAYHKIHIRESPSKYIINRECILLPFYMIQFNTISMYTNIYEPKDFLINPNIESSRSPDYLYIFTYECDRFN